MAGTLRTALTLLAASTALGACDNRLALHVHNAGGAQPAAEENVQAGLPSATDAAPHELTPAPELLPGPSVDRTEDQPSADEQPPTDEPPFDEPPPAGGAVCDQLAFNTVLASGPADEFLPSRQWSFTVADETLWVHLVMTGVTGTAHQLTLDFYVPDGFLYRRDFIKFKAGEVTGPILGYPWEYVDAVAFAEGWVVSYALPVGGSDIERWQITGGWRLAVLLDNDPNPVVSTWFAIAP